MYKLTRSEEPQKFQNGAAIPAQKNRNPITLTVIKGKDSKGTYTETTRKQSADLYPGGASYVPPVHQTNEWFNSLSPEQKKAHNEKVREKEAKLKAAAISTPVPVPGQAVVDRVYDPITQAPVKPAGKQWWREIVENPNSGSYVTKGYSIGGDEIAAGLRKNEIDKTTTYANKNRFEVLPTRSWEQKALDAGVLNQESNPLGMSTADTIRRHQNVNIRMQKIADYNSRKQAVNNSRNQSQKMVTTYKKGGPVPEDNKPVIVNGKVLHKKPVLVQKKKQAVTPKDDCNCGGGSEKMQGGGDLQKSTKLKRAQAIGYIDHPITSKKKDENKKSLGEWAKTVDSLTTREMEKKTSSTSKKQVGLLFKCGGKSKMKAKK